MHSPRSRAYAIFPPHSFPRHTSPLPCFVLVFHFVFILVHRAPSLLFFASLPAFPLFPASSTFSSSPVSFVLDVSLSLSPAPHSSFPALSFVPSSPFFSAEFYTNSSLFLLAAPHSFIRATVTLSYALALASSIPGDSGSDCSARCSFNLPSAFYLISSFAHFALLCTSMYSHLLLLPDCSTLSLLRSYVSFCNPTFLHFVHLWLLLIASFGSYVSLRTVTCFRTFFWLYLIFCNLGIKIAFRLCTVLLSCTNWIVENLFLLHMLLALASEFCYQSTIAML